MKWNVMHLLYCDETNMEEKPGDFLVYGGLMVDGEKALKLSSAIDSVRGDHKVPDSYNLKFNPGPEGFDHDKFISLKQDVLQEAAHHDVQLLVYVILHDVAKSPDEARRNGINTVCYHFNSLLRRIDDVGVVLIDRFNDNGNIIDGHLRQKFMTGVVGMPYSENIRLQNIVGFHLSAVGQSHFPSIVDVALGSLRFAINAHTRNRTNHIGTAGKLIGLIAPLFEREDNGDVAELSFLFSPKVVQVSTYRERYQSLKMFLAANGLTTAQKITGQRQY